MKKIIKFIFIISFLLIFILVIASVYMLGVSLDRKVTPTDEEDAYSYLFKSEEIKEWVDSLRSVSALKDTFIIAPDGAKLHALYVRSASQSPNTAIAIHGYTDNAIRMLMIGHIYNKEMGYNILLPDLRAHGKSDGKYIQMGWKDRLDILEWIKVAKAMYGDTTRVVVHGISMGAATTVNTSGEKLPDNVKCFVEDCGFTSVWDEFEHKLKQEYGLPAFPLLYTTSLYCQLKLGWNFKEASPLQQIKKNNRPMLFIHGGADTYVPTWMVYKLYEVEPETKEIWVLPGVDHANAYWDDTNQYKERTKTFVSKYIY